MWTNLNIRYTYSFLIIAHIYLRQISTLYAINTESFSTRSFSCSLTPQVIKQMRFEIKPERMRQSYTCHTSKFLNAICNPPQTSLSHNGLIQNSDTQKCRQADYRLIFPRSHRDPHPASVLRVSWRALNKYRTHIEWAGGGGRLTRLAVELFKWSRRSIWKFGF